MLLWLLEQRVNVIALRPHGRSFHYPFRRQLHCWGILGMNPILKGEESWLPRFLQNWQRPSKRQVFPKFCNRVPHKWCHVGLSRNLSAAHLLYNTCGLQHHVCIPFIIFWTPEIRSSISYILLEKLVSVVPVWIPIFFPIQNSVSVCFIDFICILGSWEVLFISFNHLFVFSWISLSDLILFSLRTSIIFI